MDSTVDHIQLKRAWQTAFELRTCPDGATLFAEPPNEQLQRHLQMCHVCREKREIPVEQRDAWEELLRRFGAAAQKPATSILPVPGQVWSLHRSLAGWGKDGYFYQPPRILLLEKIEAAKGFRAVQLSGDRYLMAEGDVWLDDRFGFAEGWNCYSVHEKALNGCWGAIADGLLGQALQIAGQKHTPVAEDSILYFFRRLEISVGARVALPSVAVLVEEWERTAPTLKVNSMLEELIGSFSDVYKKLRNIELPPVADSVFDLLYGARPPYITSSLSMASSVCNLPVNIINKQPDGEIRIKTICASITDDDWQDGTYFISGKLDEGLTARLHLLASLVYQGQTIAECINQVGENSFYFDIVFRNVPKEAGKLDHVKFLLVCP